jgi:sugar lactone lactonase YvrE
MAFDASGNLYAASISTGQVWKYAPDGSHTVAVAGIANPFDVAFDKTGNLYISGSNGLYKQTPTGTFSTIASVPSLPGGNFVSVVVDQAGNCYLGDYNTGAIEKVTSGGAISTFATLPYSVEGMAIDNAGDIFAIAYNGGNSSIYKVTPDGTRTLFASGLDHPEGLAFYSPPSAETPEPGTVASLASLICAGGTLIVKRRRRK